MVALREALEHNQPTVIGLTTLLWEYIGQWNTRLTQLSDVQVPTLPGTLPSTPSESNYSDFVDPDEEMVSCNSDWRPLNADDADNFKQKLGTLNDRSGATDIEAAKVGCQAADLTTLTP